MQHGFVDLRVCPVVPDVIQVIIEIHQYLVGFAVQEGRSDPLGFGPIFTEVTRVEKKPEYIGITEKNSGKLSHAGHGGDSKAWLKEPTAPSHYFFSFKIPACYTHGVTQLSLFFPRDE